MSSGWRRGLRLRVASALLAPVADVTDVASRVFFRRGELSPPAGTE